MSRLRWFCAALMILSPATVLHAGEADVVAVEVRETAERVYQFEVSVRHSDEGREHYADRWEVVGPDGTLLATRTLNHPHVNEQPFVRSLPEVKIPANIHSITVRAHDSVHGYGGATVTVTLPEVPSN